MTLAVIARPMPGETVRPSPSALDRVAIFLLVGFLLFFPKGGIKIAEVPITWGYLLLGLAWLTLPITLLRGGSWKISQRNLLSVAALVPFQMVVLASFMVNGVIGMGFAISLLVTFFLIPQVFLLVLGPRIDRIQPDFLFRAIRLGVLFVAVYGIFLFFYRLVVGSFIEIPFLTVNVGDFGTLEEAKFIDRGGIFKLISTYNNGNIYGVSMLLLLPLFGWLERRPLPNLLVKFSLLLTLSRTVWIGLILNEILQRVYVRPMRVRTAAILMLSLGGLVLGIFGALKFMKFDADFLLDPQLGARAPQVEALRESTIMPQVGFEHIVEMVYFSIIHNFGLIGLVAFCLGMFFPLALYFMRAVPHPRSPLKRSLATGLIVYLVVAIGDGALLFIPVMAFFWFVAALLMSETKGWSEVPTETTGAVAVEAAR